MAEQINDQCAGLGFKVVAGTPKDCLHAIGVFFGRWWADPGDLRDQYRLYSDLTF